mmetsp:Transcript_35607/g.44076  ORF Transcript_35607/g.44076 Transcript_35607/m.44076 type:complete len:110 (-) Transcript_35607:1156-1485(-)
MCVADICSFFIPFQSPSNRSKAFEKAQEKRNERKMKELANEKSQVNQNHTIYDPDDPLDQLSQSCANQFQAVQAMNAGLDEQNAQLEKLESVVEENQSGVEKLRKRILT